MARAVRLLAAYAVGMAAPVPLLAQALAVSPTIVEMPPGKHSAVIEVSNAAATPVDIQIRGYDWRQVEGRETLTDSATLRLSPSIVTIPAGGKQVLRMIVPDGARAQEGDWRILLDQLPRPVEGAGLQIKLRMSIPVFAYATKTATPDLRWRLADGRLEAVNAGPRFVRFNALALRTADGREAALPLGPTPYLLPGTSRSWPVTDTAVLAVAGQVGTTSFVTPIVRGPGS